MKTAIIIYGLPARRLSCLDRAHVSCSAALLAKYQNNDRDYIEGLHWHPFHYATCATACWVIELIVFLVWQCQLGLASIVGYLNAGSDQPTRGPWAKICQGPLALRQADGGP